MKIDVPGFVWYDREPDVHGVGVTDGGLLYVNCNYVKLSAEAIDGLVSALLQARGRAK